jgi:hypothetical protein
MPASAQGDDCFAFIDANIRRASAEAAAGEQPWTGKRLQLPWPQEPGDDVIRAACTRLEFIQMADLQEA